MISKLKIVNFTLAALGIAAFLFFQYAMKPEELGGYKEGTQQYYGYIYARDNKIESASHCDVDKNDPHMNINDDFLEGCRAYFE